MITEATLNEARHQVLAENTAQAVQKHLNKLFQEEPRFRSRWVWELLQNARDASPKNGVRIAVFHKNGHLVFKHNGMPFTEKGIAHLIYHGSTKYDLSDSGPIGQFGTGFLTTHLISKTVEVTGRTDDGKKFHFFLDRRGKSADDLKEAMDLSWQAFVQSLEDCEDLSEKTEDFSTEYRYPIRDEVVTAVIKEGLAELLSNAAYVFGFNQVIKSLYVEQSDHSIQIEKERWVSLPKGAKCLRVAQCLSGTPVPPRYLATISREQSVVAIEASKHNGKYSVVGRNGGSGIFVAFPLTGTNDFCLPVTINSEKFQPREERDTLVLKPAARESKSANMALMEDAVTLAMEMTRITVEEGWESTAQLLRLNPLREWDWVDQEWFRNVLNERFIQPLRQVTIMKTAAGSLLSPREGTIPVAGSSALCEELWDLVSQIRNEFGRLPEKREAVIWAENLQSWAPFMLAPVEGLHECLTLEKLCDRVTSLGSVAVVEKALDGTVAGMEWLNRLHSLIFSAGQDDLFEKQRLIPSQTGLLKKITELRRDPGIDEELKDISEGLGIGVRDELVHLEIILKKFQELKSKSGEEVLTMALQRFKERYRDLNAEGIAVRFFTWLVVHDEIEKLEGFPVLTRASTEDEAVLALLSSDPAKADECLLSPIGFWSSQAQLVADLFPKRLIFADSYQEALPDADLWQQLQTGGYVRLTPLYKTQRRVVPFIPGQLPVSDDTKVKHRSAETIELSAVAFFEKEESGLDLVRKSKTRAINLLHFLAEYVLQQYPDSLDLREADCECGEKHPYCSAAWLIPMWERRWVPQGDNKQGAPSATSLAQLFEGREEELRKLTGGSGRRLFEILGISLSDLSMRTVAKDEDTRISLIESLADIVRAASNNVEKVRLLAEEIRLAPNLIDQIQEHRERREKVLRNQSLGYSVERLLKDVLEDGHGLKVTRTGIGSDYQVERNYIIEEDCLVENSEMLLSVQHGRESVLIEIKATAGNDVRMTVKQAETAVSHKGRFALCVVPLGSLEPTLDVVRQRCRFVMDISDKIEPVWNEYAVYQSTKEKVCSPVGAVELILQGSDVRFGIREEAWSNGYGFEEAVEALLQICGEK